MTGNWLFRMGAACVLATFALPTLRADEIDPLLAKDAAALMKVFKSRGYHNIGVLKFEVQRGGDSGPVSMTNGTVNSMMATRLENALILANSEKNPIGITRNASEVAARADKTAGYHSKASRDKLFGQNYPLAWGNSKVKVDAFVTGRVTVSADYKKSIVTIRLFDRNDAKIIDAARFNAPVDRSLIVDLGQPFAVSKAVIARRALLISPNPGADQGTPTSTSEDMVLEDVQKSAKAADDSSKNLQPAPIPVVPAPEPKSEDNVRPNPIRPAANTQAVRMQAPRADFARTKAELDSVLKFDVYYNDQLVQWTGDNRLPAPNVGDKVEIRVRANERIGMILRVNGVNTADYDRTDKDINDYTKWVLEPNTDYTIQGFYPTSGKCVLFDVQNREDVDLSELGNERRIGKIDLDILREAPKVAAAGRSNDTPAINSRGMDLRAVAKADNVAELKGKLRSLSARGATLKSRGAGIMLGGQVVDTKVDTTTFVGVHAIHMPITYFDARTEQQPTFLQPENNE